MNCEQVQALLLAYLDGEVTPSERILILAHLSRCTVCQQELNLLSTARSQIRSALQHRAIQAVPSQEAWSRLEARLPKVQENSLPKMQESFLPEAAQPSSKFLAWLPRKAPSADHASNQLFGGIKMQRRWIFSGLAGVIVLSVLAILIVKNVTPVSAREILDRAYDVQTQQAASQGIQHIRNEIYINLEALPEKPGTDTTVESYLDLQTGNSRLVVIDNKTGKVLEAYAYDGINAYSSENSKDEQPGGGSLTIYRSPQGQPSTITENLRNSNEDLDAKTMFDKMRNDPDVQFAGKETWEDGRIVYVLRSEQPIKVFVANELQQPTGLVTVYFDVDTYELLGNRVTMEKDGKEVLVNSQRVLVDEILPEGSTVAWGLSDLQGVSIVDDTSSEHALPEVVSVEALATRTQTAYLLQTIPDGFSLEVSVLPKQPGNEPFFYRATYNKGNDYFMIRTFGNKKIEDASWADETYTTASGLILHFVVEPGVTPSGGQFTSALMETPEGVTFAINSTVPRDQVKALAEELVLINK